MFLCLDWVYLLQKSKPDDPEEENTGKKHREDVTSQSEAEAGGNLSFWNRFESGQLWGSGKVVTGTIAGL